MVKQIELRRHTDAEGDRLTEAGMGGAYQLVVSSGARRTTDTAANILAGLGQEAEVIVEPGLRSSVEDRWRAAYQRAGAGDLGSLREADPELVAEDSAVLAGALSRVFDRLQEGERALAVGHSPTNEAAVYGLTGQMVEPLGKGEGVAITWDGESYRVERLAREEATPPGSGGSG